MKKVLWIILCILAIFGCQTQEQEDITPTQTNQPCVTSPSIEKNIIGTWQNASKSFEITFYENGAFSDKKNYLAPFFQPNYIYQKTWKVLNAGKTLELTLDGIDISPNQLGTNTKKLVFTYDIQINECNKVAFTPNQTFDVPANITQRVLERVSSTAIFSNEKCNLSARNNFQFEYDNLGRISKYKLINDASLTFSYNGISQYPAQIFSQNMTRSWTDNQTDKNKPYYATTLYEYDGNNLLKSVSYSTQNPNYAEKATIETNSKGQVTKVSLTNSLYLFEYDNEGNISKQTYQYPFSGKQYKNITTYKYDNKANPLNMLGQAFLIHLCTLRFTSPNYGLGTLGVGLGVNNPIEITTDFERTQTSQRLTLQYSYDEKQRPISTKYTTLSMPDNAETLLNLSFEYKCASFPIYE